MNRTLPIVAALLMGFAGGMYVPKSIKEDTSPIPVSIDPEKPIAVPDRDQVKTITANRIEILDKAKKVVLVFTVSSDGLPIAIVVDKGTQRTIDLGRAARMLK